MREMNQIMISEIEHANTCAQQLPRELDQIVADGFLESDGCFLLRALAKRDTNTSLQDFPDRTGYECFVNSIHLDDYVSENCLILAFAFAEALLSAWRKSGRDEPLKLIISSDEFGALVKCHVVRPSESWLAPDLERYEEAVLVVDSTFEGRISSL